MDENNNNKFDSIQNSDNNSNEINKDIERDEEIKIDETKLFFDSLIDLYEKRQYKKMIKLFCRDEEKRENEKESEEEEDKDDRIITEENWILSYLETISIQKIIQNKNLKYYKSSKVPKFNKYIKHENKIINKWLIFIGQLIKNNNDNKNIKSFLEFLITFILQKCLNLSKHCLYLENFKEAVSFLSLGINLINHSYYFFRSPETFILCAEIFLNLSIILFGDSKYESSINLISFACKFFYISVESILYSTPNNISYSIFNLSKQEENSYNILSKILFYLSICFYVLGVWYENKGFPYSSFYAYKQSKFLASLIKNKNKDTIKFYNFVKETEKRQLMRNRIIIFFEKFVKKEDLIDIEIPKKKVDNQFILHLEKKAKRFNKLEKYISNMKLVDVDKDEPRLFDKINKQFKYNVSLATKQIHLLDYLMSDNFQEIIKNMNKIRINKLDKETISIIQKSIINLKNNEREKLRIKKEKKKLKNKTSKSLDKEIKEKEDNREKGNINYKTIKTSASSKTFNSGKKTRVSSSYKNSHVLLTDVNNISLKTDSCFSFNSRPTTAHNEVRSKGSPFTYFSLKSLSKRNKILLTENIKNDRNPHKNKLLFSSSAKDIHFNIKNRKLKYKIPKYSYDKYLFNKSFMKKKETLENQYSNEIIFQKQLLSCKKQDLSEPKNFNLIDIQKECDRFYFTTFEKEMMYIKERNNIFGKKKKLYKNTKIKEKKNNTFFNTIKSKEIIINDLVNNKVEYNIGNLNKKNFETIDKLFNDIVYLSEKEKIIEKRYGKI